MRFSFKLETLLNWKKTLEELSQESLFEKKEELRLQEEEIRRLTLLQRTCDQKLAEELKQGMKGGTYLLFKEFEDASNAELSLKERAKGEVLEKVAEEQERLVGLMKERKILSRLREKQWRQFHREMEKQEQKVIDEIVVRRYSDKKSDLGKRP